jgi:hypothetical protein
MYEVVGDVQTLVYNDDLGIPPASNLINDLNTQFNIYLIHQILPFDNR